MVLGSSDAADSYNDYYLYGEQMPGRNGAGSADGRYKYIGVEQDAETGLYAMGRRTYDPWRGGFNQTEPVTTDTILMGWSMYQYGFDNPVRFKDPTGKWPDWATLGVQVGSWLASQQSALGTWVRNALGTDSRSSEQMQAETEQQNSTLGMPTNAQVDQTQFKVGSEFLYATGLAQLRATEFTFSHAGTGAAFGEGLGTLSLLSAGGKAGATLAYNSLTDQSTLIPTATSAVSIGLSLTPYSSVSKGLSLSLTSYNYISLYFK